MGTQVKSGEGSMAERRLPVRLLVLGVAVVLLLGGSTYGYLKNRHQPSYAKRVFSASEIKAHTDYTGAQQDLSQQAAAVQSPNLKVGLYMQKAALAFNSKRYDEAKGYAQQAETIMPTMGTAELLAQIAVAQGDTATARAEYQKAIDRVDPSSPIGQQQKDELTVQLGQVGQ